MVLEHGDQGEERQTWRCEAEDADAGMRLDRFLAGRIETISRSRLQDLIREGHASVGGNPVLDPNAKVKAGAAYDLDVPPPVPSTLEAEEIALDIRYEDASLLVIDKPPGLVVHPGAGNFDGTLVHALLAHCGDSLSGIGGVARPGIVHRLDKDTSGLMVIAKTDVAHRDLAAQFADHGRSGELLREYLCVVWGEPKPSRGRIQSQIGRHPASRVKMAVLSSGGRVAVTTYETEAVYAPPLPQVKSKTGAVKAVASKVRCRLETGRTHQVRVHMAHIGTPIIGDPLYSTGFLTKANTLSEPIAGAVALMERQALHAATLRFRHPVNGRIMRFDSELPADIAKMCEAFDRTSASMSKN